MGVSWLLRCEKCYEAVRVMHNLMEDDVDEELDLYDAIDSIGADYHLFYLEGTYDNKEKVAELQTWLKKHARHGKIIFTGE